VDIKTGSGGWAWACGFHSVAFKGLATFATDGV